MSDSTENPPPGSFRPPPPPPVGASQPQLGQPGYGPDHRTPLSGIGQPADLLMRFLARLIDGLVLAVVNFVVVGLIIVGALAGGRAGPGNTGGSFVSSAIYAILTSVISLGYFAFLESRNGQTLGKMALNLQTQGPDGQPPTMEMALKRNAFMAIGVLGIIPVLGLFAPLVSIAAYVAIAVTIHGSPTRQGWHDNLAGGTRVIKVG